MIFVTDGDTEFEFGSITLGERTTENFNLDFPYLEGVYVDWRKTVREIPVQDVVFRGKNRSGLLLFALPEKAAQSLFDEVRKEVIIYGKAASHELRLNLSALRKLKLEPTEAEYSAWKAAVFEELDYAEESCVREFERVSELKKKVAALP